MSYNKENDLTANIIIAVFAIIIILGLAFLYYYYSIKMQSFSQSSPVNSSAAVSASLSEKINPEDFTKVIKFSVPENLPEISKSGKCWTNSVAYPYREDAFRCIVENSVYDPCFTTNQKDIVFCQTNPTKESSFLIKLTEDLPVAKLPEKIQDNWSWFVLLKDGTYCPPYTGTRPLVEKNIAYYGCNSQAKDEVIVLMGDLKKGDVWKATRAVLTQEENKWKTKSSEVVEIDSVWQ
jgi:hypothetical protein